TGSARSAGRVEAGERVAVEVAIDDRVLRRGREARAVDDLAQNVDVGKIAGAGVEAGELREELRAADRRVRPQVAIPLAVALQRVVPLVRRERDADVASRSEERRVGARGCAPRERRREGGTGG